MPVQYNVYANDGNGSAVNFDQVIARTSGQSCDVGPLQAPADYTYAVRVYDPSTGLEDCNTDALIRIIVDANGNDVSNPPSGPHALTVSRTLNEGCRVEWAYRQAAYSSAPTVFEVALLATTQQTDQAITVTVPFVSGQHGYSCTVDGPLPYGSYTVSVRSYNAAGPSTAYAVLTTNLGSLSTSYIMDPITMIQGQHS